MTKKTTEPWNKGGKIEWNNKDISCQAMINWNGKLNKRIGKIEENNGEIFEKQ